MSSKGYFPFFRFFVSSGAEVSRLHKEARLADPRDGRTRRFVIQSGDNGDGDEPVFALSRKPEQESVSSDP